MLQSAPLLVFFLNTPRVHCCVCIGGGRSRLSHVLPSPFSTSAECLRPGLKQVIPFSPSQFYSVFRSLSFWLEVSIRVFHPGDGNLPASWTHCVIKAKKILCPPGSECLFFPVISPSRPALGLLYSNSFSTPLNKPKRLHKFSAAYSGDNFQFFWFGGFVPNCAPGPRLISFFSVVLQIFKTMIPPSLNHFRAPS